MRPMGRPSTTSGSETMLRKPQRRYACISASLRSVASRSPTTIGSFAARAATVASYTASSRSDPTSSASQPRLSMLARQRSLSPSTCQMSQSSALSTARSRSATARASSSSVPASLRRSPSSTSSRSAVLPRRNPASRSALRRASATVLPASGRNQRTSLKSRSLHVEDVDEPDHLVVAHERDGEHAAEVELGEVLALVVGQALVVQRADHQDLAVLQRLPRGRVVVEPEDPPAHALVDAGRVHAGEAAEVALLGPPDVAVGAADGVSQARGRALGDVHRLLGGGQVGAQLDELLAQAGDLPGFVEQCGAVEHAGDQLADAGQELDVGAPVPLGVVVEVHEPDELATGHQRHRERAREAPLAHHFDLARAQAFVAQVADRQRREVEERALQRRVSAGVEDLVAHARVGAVSGQAHDRADHAAARAPHVDAVGAGGGQQPLREAQDEPLEVVGLRYLAGEVHKLAHGLVAVRELVHGGTDRGGLGADPGEALQHVGVPREVAVPRVAQLDGADQLVVQHHRRPGERAAAAALHRLPRAAAQSPLRRAHAGDPRGGRVALDRHPLARGPRGTLPPQVELAGLHRDGEAQQVGIAGEDVTARRARERAQGASGLRRHFAGIVREQRHEVQAGLEDGTQVLGLAAEFGEVAGMRGAVASPRTAGGRARRRRGSGGGRRDCDGRRCARRRSSDAPCSRSRRARRRRRRRVARLLPAPLSRWPLDPPVAAPAGPPIIGTIPRKLDQNSHAVWPAGEVREDDGRVGEALGSPRADCPWPLAGRRRSMLLDHHRRTPAVCGPIKGARQHGTQRQG